MAGPCSCRDAGCLCDAGKELTVCRLLHHLHLEEFAGLDYKLAPADPELNCAQLFSVYCSYPGNALRNPSDHNKEEQQKPNETAELSRETDSTTICFGARNDYNTDNTVVCREGEK